MMESRNAHAPTSTSQQMGEVMHVSSHTRALHGQKGEKRKGGKVRGNLDVRVGMGTHTEPQPEPAGPTLRPEGPPGTPEAELAAKLFHPFFHIFDFNPGRYRTGFIFYYFIS